MADHKAPVGHPIAIHFGRLAPVPTACGRTRVPATTNWRDVCCWSCLSYAPPAPWLEARRAEVAGKYREWLASPGEPVDPVQLCVRCAGPTRRTGWACVSCHKPLCSDCGDTEPSVCGVCD